MAKITLQNTREHDITISALNTESQPTQVTIPGARQSPEDKNVLINGEGVADEDFIDASLKSPVVAHYFEEGWLSITKPTANTKAKKAAEAKE